MDAHEPLLSCLCEGPAEAPAVLFLHGAGLGAWSFTPQRAALREQYRCLTPDLPGHGDNARIGPFTIADAARRVAALVRAAVPSGRAHVVGLSLGGQVALELCASHPAVVCSALVTGTSVMPMARWARALVLASLRASLPLTRYAWFARANFRQYRWPEPYFAEYFRASRALTEATLTQSVAASLAFELPAGLGASDAPLLVLAGAHEPRTIGASQRALRAAVPRAVCATVSGVAHGWNLEQPALFSSVVRAWVEGRPLPEGLVPA